MTKQDITGFLLKKTTAFSVEEINALVTAINELPDEIDELPDSEVKEKKK